MGGSRTARQRRKNRGATFNVHIEGMVFPFPDTASRKTFLDEVLTEHPDMAYSLSIRKMETDEILVGE